MVILDASFLIDLLRGNPIAKNKVNELDESGKDKYLASITAMELYYGAMQSGKKDDAIKVMSLLLSLNKLNFEFNSGIKAAEIKHELEKKGMMIDIEDIMLAGIAKTMEQKILTRNVKHFERVEGLKLESY